MSTPQQAVLAGIPDASQRDIVARYLDGNLSAEMALMYWLLTTRSIDAIQAALGVAIGASMAAGSAQHTAALTTLCALAAANHNGCERIAGMLRSGVDTDEPAPSVEEGIAFCKRLFDWSVGQCAEASVALYSLGNPAILDAATGEIVVLMREWQLLGRARRLLEIGCGIGRFQKALAAHVLAVDGIDVSANMIRAARSRCAGCTNVTLQECSGRDLALFAPASFDFVYAVDSFPYLYQSGMTLVEKHFREVRRVLKPGGDFLILEFSYRSDIDSDRRDVKRLASTGFDVLVDGTRPFSLWDGAVFHLRART